MNITYSTQLPDEHQFFQLFQTTGWDPNQRFTSQQLITAIASSWYWVGAYDGKRLIGFGRVISDGVYQALICDLIVHPDYQGQKIGSTIMEKLLEKCRLELFQVQLFAANGKSDFYKKFGFTERDPLAPGMQLRLKD